MNFKSSIAVVATVFAFIADAYEVKNVSASSRWPWNGYVYVDYELERGDSPVGLYTIDVSATAEDGALKLEGRTIVSGQVAGVGKNRIVWDFGADHPGVIARDLKVTVTATPKIVRTGTEEYCVIDLSGGPNATCYPVRYQSTGPDHVQGALGEPCQTTELWLKRVDAGTFGFRATDSKSSGNFTVKLTKPMYACLFECTQQQWYQVMGTWPSKFVNAEFRASRPVENITHSDILGQVDWPDDKTVADNSFVGRMRARTGLLAFNLPTEAQMEYVSRAGSTKTALNNHGRHNQSTPADFNVTTNEGTACVGSYTPNNWGFYDVVGNVAEWTLDTYASEDSASGGDLSALYADEIADPGYVTDPQGPANSTSVSDAHTLRGGGYKSNANATRLISRSSSSSPASDAGARFVITCE